MNHKESLEQQILDLIESEARSCSMEAPSAEYVYRYWSGQIPFDEIVQTMQKIKEYE